MPAEKKTLRTDVPVPDKYDLLVQHFDPVRELVDRKNQLQEKIAAIQQEYQERIGPLERELASVMRKLEQKIAMLEPSREQLRQTRDGYTKYGRGQLGEAIRRLLRSNPDKKFRPKEIAEALNTKGTSISLWLNKYGACDDNIQRIPVGSGGRRFVYQINERS
ncbi:hypothetical protein [Prosthecochloris sp. HL-130-GSB]|jgi:chromosome segregation ATPase|uniref:Uncharacterized protein n=1 Tax=Prosthecochloris aestuarii TaxID=1102 RepID=A0A831SQR5_PROAE|nr:hypothetical protein [Prosthecochloris sp. HL-130-GSB]ARM31408.1 hypothetical protein B9H02_09000 [Prosthecochloris sp. HL-130-GSB]MBO8093471.1 hypothetical protein [Prosthecochloris sp.]HED30405.1 hypothetical protein [Prosthecochloris aestuarii]